MYYRRGEWTRAGCLTVMPDVISSKTNTPVLVNCTCNQLSTFTVLVDEISADVSLCNFILILNSLFQRFKNCLIINHELIFLIVCC